jgi:hypothetical protein
VIGFQLGPWRLVLCRPRLEPRDLWVGLYWTRKASGLHLYLCAVPAVLLHVIVARNG